MIININGKVVKGQQFGRVLGYPTANIDRKDFSRQKLKLKLGIYFGYTELSNSKKFVSAIVIGPMDKRKLPKIEAHIIGFKGNLYGKKITITLSKFIRSFKKFKTIEQLKKQIHLDVERIKKLGK